MWASLIQFVRTDQGDDEKRDDLDTDDDPPIRTLGSRMSNAVETCEDEMILAPSVAEAGTVRGGERDINDTQSMVLVQADRMVADEVDSTRVSPVMMTSTEVEEEGGLSQNTSIMTVPSVENKGYPGNSTSRNFTITTNPIVLEAPTVDGGATQPGVMDDDRPAQGVEEEPSQGVARSSQTQRRCVHNKKGVCADHGPVAKWKWKPGTKKVTGEDGVTRVERTKIHYWWCDPGPKGRGLLKQTGISRFLTSAQGRREGNLTVGDTTLLGAGTTHTEGQGSSADTMAGIKRNVGEC